MTGIHITPAAAAPHSYKVSTTVGTRVKFDGPNGPQGSVIMGLALIG
jgi:hypothetical protein